MRSMGYAQIIDVSTVKGLADIKVIPEIADLCVVQVEAQSCRWRDDDTSPTAAIGFLLAVGDMIVVQFENLKRFKIIEAFSGAKVSICYYTKRL